MLPARIQNKIKRILPYIERLHPANKIQERPKYPQLWNVWPLRKNWPRTRKAIEKICGFLTGHEISETEWGYGGGKFVDRHCRWCDKLIKVPKEEEIPPSSELKDMLDWQ